MINVSTTANQALDKSPSWHALAGKVLREGFHDDFVARLKSYSILVLVCLTLVWLPVGLFILLSPPIYKSEWTLILPGTGSGHAVALENVGQASTTVASPFSNTSIDPKVNYKALIESATVLQRAANLADMSSADFGKPRIKLTDQTALMEFTVSAGSPVLAKRKSDALYQALQLELERLRSDELRARSSAVDSMLSGFDAKLNDAQAEILDFQNGSAVVSQEQFSAMTQNLEALRKQLELAIVEKAQTQGQLDSLRQTLQLDVNGARDHMLLQKDPLFTELSKKWAKAYAVLSEYNAIWGPKHEKVIAARDKESSLKRKLKTRMKDISPEFANADQGPGIRTLADTSPYLKMIELRSLVAAKQQEIRELEAQSSLAESRLLRAATDATELQNLVRKQQVATAVFTTALAKVDIGKADRFSSYPLVQLLAEPSTPEHPDTLPKKMALLGGLVGTAFCLFGVFLLWARKAFFRKISKNE